MFETACTPSATRENASGSEQHGHYDHDMILSLHLGESNANTEAYDDFSNDSGADKDDPLLFRHRWQHHDAEANKLWYYQYEAKHHPHVVNLDDLGVRTVADRDVLDHEVQVRDREGARARGHQGVVAEGGVRGERARDIII